MTILLNIDHTHPKSLSDQIGDQLRLRIRNGQLQPGQKIPSIRVLSEQMNVSLGIVQRAVELLVRENYLRSRQGQGVFVSERQLEAQTVALVLPTCEIEQMPLMIRGLKTALRQQTANLVVMASDADFDEEVQMIRQLDRPFISGAVIYAPPTHDAVAALDALKQKNIPFVLVDTLIDADFEIVTTNWHQLGKMVFEQALKQGHRKIGVIGKNLRHRGYREILAGADHALADVGFSLADLPCVDVDATDLQPKTPWANGQKAAEQLLGEHPEITVVVALSEYLALGAFRAIEQLGRKMPDDLSLISLGDLDIFQMLKPAVTAVSIPHEQMAVQAGQRLLQIIQAPEATSNSQQIVTVEPELIVRQSVGLKPVNTI